MCFIIALCCLYSKRVCLSERERERELVLISCALCQCSCSKSLSAILLTPCVKVDEPSVCFSYLSTSD